MGELRNCPFCGSEARDWYEEIDRVHRVLCSQPGVCAVCPEARAPTRAAAVAAWNRRAEATPGRDEIRERWFGAGMDDSTLAASVEEDGLLPDLIADFRAALDRRAEDGGAVTLAALRTANETRQREWDRDERITLVYRANELAGETGEACNVAKKLERERLGIRGSRDTVEHLAEELADVVICCDLLAMHEGIDLGAAVVAKFNATSEKNGLATRLAAPAPAPVGGPAVLGVDLASGPDKSMATLRTGDNALVFELTPERMEVLRGWAAHPPGVEVGRGPCQHALTREVQRCRHGLHMGTTCDACIAECAECAVEFGRAPAPAASGACGHVGPRGLVCGLARGHVPTDHATDYPPASWPGVACKDTTPAWFKGRWRDWHRGHGCSHDDGKPRTPEGAAEIAGHAAAPTPDTRRRTP